MFDKKASNLINENKNVYFCIHKFVWVLNATK